VSQAAGASQTDELTSTNATGRNGQGARWRPSRAEARPWLASANGRFWLGISAAVVVGTAIRVAYLFHGAPALPLGDGLDYHLSAHRLADGLGYTAALGDVGAESAHHPPGWVTVLAAVTEVGGRSVRAHQVTGLVIGLGVVGVAGLVGRRYAGPRVGVLAAFLAAVYPGFWVLDVQVLSEPLGLLVTGLLMLVLAGLWERPSLPRALLAGGLLGALALVRSEQIALLVIAVAPILLLHGRTPLRHRLGWTGAATLAAVAVISPWTIHNLGRFDEPVVLSTNFGPTLLSGNCPPATYTGEALGTYDTTCIFAITFQQPTLDAAQVDLEARDVAFDNMRDNLGRLPATALARYGRLLGVFRPAQTVGLDADWLGTATWPVWAWITSFWLLLPLVVYGGVHMRRSGRFQWPLVAPVTIVLFVTTVGFGAPRYHTMADLGLVVLAAVALDHLARRRPGLSGRARADGGTTLSAGRAAA
jgi:4-amino-4-deoxy-L-arabinose transferase-like glycosyltransferase